MSAHAEHSPLLLKLLRVEYIKTRRRFAFGVSLLVFFGIMTVANGGQFLMHRNAPGVAGIDLPDSWGGIIQTAAPLGSIVMLVMVVLLVASERTWRTERQNVIDGLSRTQYFVSKLLLVILLALLLTIGTFVIGLVFGILTRQVTPTDAALFDAVAVKMFGGFLLRLAVTGTLALLVSMIASGSGAALALAFVFLVAQPIVMAMFAMRGGALQRLVPYFPAQVLDALTSRASYAGAGPLDFDFGFTDLSLGAAVLVAVTYGVLFAAGAWASVRARDL